MMSGAVATQPSDQRSHSGKAKTIRSPEHMASDRLLMNGGEALW
jgi:hypothetical protein